MSAVTGGFTLQNNQILSGSGAINGNFTTAAGSQIQPGTNGTIGTLTFNNNLALSGGSLDFDLAAPDSPGAGSDLINLGGVLTASNTTSIVINPLGSLLAGTYKLLGYNSASSVSAANFTATSTINGLLLGLSVGSTELDLIATSINGPIWNSASGGNWSAVPSLNWSSSNSSVPNAQGATANLFGALQTSGTVNLDVPVTLGTLNIQNANASYTIAGSNTLTMDNSGSTALINVLANLGNSHAIQAAVVLNGPTTVTVTDLGSTLAMSGNISGSGALTKAGAGIVLLSGSNTFGGTIVSGGTLQISAIPSALPNAPLSITSGVLDLGGLSPTVGSVGISGGVLQNGTLTATNFSISGGEVTSTAPLVGGSFVVSGGLIDANASLTGGSITISGTP